MNEKKPDTENPQEIPNRPNPDQNTPDKAPNLEPGRDNPRNPNDDEATRFKDKN